MQDLLHWFEAHRGPAAGVATSLLWTLTALLFTAASRRIGATVVNGTRILIAIVLLGVTHYLWHGYWIPQANAQQVLLLALSGLVGLTIGDWALFTAFVRIGPRLAMLIMTTAPIFAALFGWAALGETLGTVALLGIGLTISGVAWVVLERPGNGQSGPDPARAQGILLAFLAAACQAGGLWLSKEGMGHGWMPPDQHIDPQTATLIRMFFAGVTVIPTLAWYQRYRRGSATVSLPRPTNRRRQAGYLFTLCGAIVGPYLGVWMSLEAAHHASLGVAQTTCSLPPVFLLPFAVLIHKEHISPRAVLGAILAVAGVALLFSRSVTPVG